VDGLRLTSELLVSGALFIVVFVLSAVFLRRRLIARGGPMTVCALREPADGRWRFGLLRYGSTGLEWFKLLGFSVRPARQWERELLDIGTGTPLESGERAEILIPAAVRLDCLYAGEVRFEIALGRAPYTALRSWIEASPPGRNVNVA